MERRERRQRPLVRRSFWLARNSFPSIRPGGKSGVLDHKAKSENAQERRLEGSRFRSHPRDLAHIFSACEQPQNFLLNRRLPRTTERPTRVVCLLVREIN